MQVTNIKIHNQVGTGIKPHKTPSSESEQKKTSQTKDVTLKLKTKGSRRFRTATNRIKTRTVKPKSGSLHNGNWKKWFTPSAAEHAEQQQQTVEEHSAHCIPTTGKNSATTLASTNQNFFESDHRYSCRRY